LTQIAAIGPLSIDVVGEQPPRPGGTVFYGARAFARLGASARIAASCAASDRGALVPPLEDLGLPVRWYESAETTAFHFQYSQTGRRTMRVEAVGDPWSPERSVEAAGDARWVLVGGLLRSDFPQQALIALANTGARLLLDAQGLVRLPSLGPLRRTGDIGDVLRHATILKLDEEEAESLGASGLEALRRLGVPEVVYTLGPRGAAVVTPDLAEDVPAPDVRGAVDPTGAGDTLAAAYLFARSAGAEPLEALRSAIDTVAQFLTEK
jgi:sugar/nucleoside kinase (ribokinase family)